MSVVIYTGLDSVPPLIIYGAVLPSNCIADTRACHQVSLVGRVYKHFPLECLSGECGHGHNLTLFRDHTRLPVQPLIPVYRNTVLADEVFKNFLGHVRFKNPHGAVFSIHSRGSLAFISILFVSFPFPGAGVIVVKPHPVVKLPG